MGSRFAHATPTLQFTSWETSRPHLAHHDRYLRCSHRDLAVAHQCYPDKAALREVLCVPFFDCFCHKFCDQHAKTTAACFLHVAKETNSGLACEVAHAGRLCWIFETFHRKNSPNYAGLRSQWRQKNLNNLNLCGRSCAQFKNTKGITPPHLFRFPHHWFHFPHHSFRFPHLRPYHQIHESLLAT